MKIASNAQMYVERIRQALDPDTFERVMKIATVGMRNTNITHIESALKRVVGNDQTSKLIHSAKDRERAIGAVGSAVRGGELPPVSKHMCAIEGCCNGADDYHHWSYLKQHRLPVIPLCNKCHGGVHSGRIKLDNPQSMAICPDVLIDIKVFQSERADLETLATDAGMDVSEYIRSLIWPK